MTLVDRVNLHYKIGSFITVPFTDEEQEIVDLVGKSETFEDYTTCKQRLCTSLSVSH